MNRRKAKKAVKKKWHIKKWSGNIDPREMNEIYIAKALEQSILERIGAK